MVDPQAFKAGMRRLASGIALVTTRHGDLNQGIAATSVTALTAEPPTLLVCINRSASCHDAIAAAERFCVSILSSDHSDWLMMDYGVTASRSVWVGEVSPGPCLALIGP